MSTAALEDHLRLALRARQSGRTAESRSHFDAVLAIDPDHPRARNVLGLEALASGDAKTAAGHFESARRGDPTAPELCLNLAAAYQQLRDDQGARGALEQALALDQRHLPALIGLAQLHEGAGEEGPATERWSAVLALAGQIDDPPPELAEIVSHARAFVERSGQRLAQAIDKALADDLAAAPERDRRRARAAADAMVGRRLIYANHCHGLHYPFLPADEFFDRDLFPWLPTLESATADIRAELEALLGDPEPGLVPYIEQPSGVPDNKWSPLDRSLDWGALHLWHDGNPVEDACRRAPKTAALVETLPLCRIAGRAPAVFFSILKAGKRIPPHTGVTNVRAIVHLPLIVPDGCTFRVGGETRPWVEGEAFVFDDTIEHEAHNPTDRDRALLILDIWNPHLSEAERAMICKLYEVTSSEQPPMRAD